MEEIDVASQVIEYMSFAHDYGEAANSALDRWIGASFAMILLGYFAPERLKVGVTSMIVSLYTLYSFFIMSNAGSDNNRASAVARDALDLATANQLEMNIIAQFDGTAVTSTMIIPIFVVGLLFGTNGFLISCCMRNLANKKAKEGPE